VTPESTDSSGTASPPFHRVRPGLDQQHSSRALIFTRVPDAPQLVALQLEEQLALGEPDVRIFDRHPRSRSHTIHRARPVIALGDDPSKCRTRSGDPRRARQGACRRDRGRALGDGPGLQHAVHLERRSQCRRVGRVLVDHESRPRGSRGGGAPPPPARACGRANAWPDTHRVGLTQEAGADRAGFAGMRGLGIIALMSAHSIGSPPSPSASSPCRSRCSPPASLPPPFPSTGSTRKTGPA